MDDRDISVDVDLDGDTPSLGRLKQQHDDLRRTLDHHLNDFEEQAERANRIARFDGVVLAIFVGFLSNSSQEIPLQLFLMMVLGFSILLLAVGKGLWEQTGVKVVGGPKETVVKQGSEYEMGEEEYLEWILSEGYSEWMRDAREKAADRAEHVQFIAQLSILGIGILLGATLLVPVF